VSEQAVRLPSLSPLVTLNPLINQQLDSPSMCPAWGGDQLYFPFPCSSVWLAASQHTHTDWPGCPQGERTGPS